MQKIITFYSNICIPAPEIVVYYSYLSAFYSTIVNFTPILLCDILYDIVYDIIYNISAIYSAIYKIYSATLLHNPTTTMIITFTLKAIILPQ